jgi:hypothetical protein
MPGGDKLILVDKIESHIIELSGQNVLLDHDPASLYGSSTKVLSQRNVEPWVLHDDQRSTSN